MPLLYGHRIKKIKRLYFQILGIILSNLHIHGFVNKTIYQGGLKNFCIPILNCHGCPAATFGCPIGAIQHFVSIRKFPLYVIGFIGIIGTFTGRLLCGWFCPFGFLQDILYKIKSIKIKLPKWTSYLKYLSFIILVLILPYILKDTWFCKLCPQGALQAGLPILRDEAMRTLIGKLFYIKMIILGIFLFLFVITKRPFCKIACPLGAFYSIFNYISMVRLKIDKTKCNECGLCIKKCPMGLIPYKEINSLDCILCSECKKICPNNA